MQPSGAAMTAVEAPEHAGVRQVVLPEGVVSAAVSANVWPTAICGLPLAPGVAVAPRRCVGRVARARPRSAAGRKRPLPLSCEARRGAGGRPAAGRKLNCCYLTWVETSWKCRVTWRTPCVRWALCQIFSGVCVLNFGKSLGLVVLGAGGK